MSVILDPHVQLGFQRPLTQLVKRTLQVTNPNAQPVAFKVKTTAPKQYCVRPNSGRIEPGEKVEVQVLLQPMKEEPSSTQKCRDKFLVQSTLITADREQYQLTELWGVVEKEDKSLIHEQKIRCAYLPAPTAPVPEENENGDQSISHLPENGGDETKYNTVRNSSVPTNDRPQQPFSSNKEINPVAAAQSAYASQPADAPITEKAAVIASAAAGAAAAGAGAAVAATKNAVNGTISNNSRAVPESKAQQPAVPASNNSVVGDVKSAAATVADKSSDQLAALQKEVLALKQQLQQKAGNVDVQQVAQEGVPVHIVAAIALGVFTITYLFF
ncbi:phosphatidylinositol-binding protein scs2 [Tilletia horrida]|uniref:Phosphatidylinositol-binding protein scs2 n=1 Tax=Tilletia horrida TaxID=155126 RepID=A0AAN6JW22_9BASI|nr:phosphatidylinositol-binding protein scs2 [Tilletia horrida]KAK0556213.1 phosphatidylinositol-binding protein scs2 [Tilletia horrida]KAK0569124.1 phosphatidylinositol-binding protein scs2 [Tilletia horrida]